MRENVLIASSNTKLAGILAPLLGPDYSVTSAPAGSGLARPDLETTDAVILDIGGECGFGEDYNAVVATIVGSGVPVVVIADDDQRQKGLELVERGAHSCVRNPPSLRELRTALRKACDGRTLVTELESARQELENVRGLDQLVGSGANMQLVYKLIRKVANLENTVLVTGESGTGKELIAHAIHNTGNRKNRPFVAVSCGAIPESLIEAELFGHEKGAFTGSVGQREGYFERAGDGTLFLDEIGEVSPQIQVKLLRVLQQREFNRLGSTRNIPLRARIVLATHRDLSQLVAQGQFRQDLFYRINVMNIKAPALRHHAEDIPLLVPFFIRKYAELYRKPVDSIDPEALAMLQSYSWPGNVRELENIIQGALIMAEGYSIEAQDLPETFHNFDPQDINEEPLSGGTFERLLREYKVKLAVEAIQQCGGNKTLAAQSLSISRAYLHRLIRLTGPTPIDCVKAEASTSRANLQIASGQ